MAGPESHPRKPVEIIHTTLEHIMRTQRPSLSIVVAITSVVALSACGSGSADGPAPTASTPASDAGTTSSTVTIGGLLVGANAAINVGIDDGTFAEHGLNITFNSGLDGPAQLPALTTGATQFSICNPTSLLIANDRGLDVRLVSGFNYAQEKEPDRNGVVVKEDSGIDSFADLPGHTVSVNAVQTHGDLMIKAATERASADPESINFNELDFADMLAQLEIDNTDAVWLPEPFLSMAESEPGLKVLGYPFYDVDPGSPVQMICAAGDYVEENPETVDAMRAALSDLAESVTEDDAAVREELVEFLNLPEEVAQSMGLENYETEIRDEQLSTLNELMVEYDMLTEQVDLESIIVP